MPTATSTACGRREKLKQSSDARKSVGVFCVHFSLHCALFQAQGEGIGEHGDELGIRRLALDVRYGVAEKFLQHLDVAAVPRDLDGVITKTT